MAADLSRGCIDRIKSGELANVPVTVQISDLKLLAPDKNRYECTIKDGEGSISGFTTSDVGKQVAAGRIKDGSIISLSAYACSAIGSVHKLVITDCATFGDHPAQDGATPTDSIRAHTSVPSAKPQLVDADVTTPVAQVKGAFNDSKTPWPTPSPHTSGLKPRACQPISALNPYCNAWTIKAKVASKAPLRHFQKNGQEQAVFSVEVVDEQGTTIEITLWRELAEKFYYHLEEGRVYYFKRGNVKLANRNYQNVRNDYIIHMDNGSDIEACTDGDSGKMRARLKYVGIEQLGQYAGRKMLVDVLGLVTNVGALGSVKRTRDGTELARRDITLVDESAKTVVMTLWGLSAEEDGARLEHLDNPIISITSCRVTDFAGVSLSTLSRSSVNINPAGNDRADVLRLWWDTQGHTVHTKPVGEGLCDGVNGQFRGRAAELATLVHLRMPKEELPPTEAKPMYRTVVATMAAIDPAQTLFYEACPANNRKVVQQGEGWYCEFDGRTYPDMVRRYVMQVKCMDGSGEAILSVFDEQAKQMLGLSADEIAKMKEDSNQVQYEGVLKRAMWNEWLLRIQIRTQVCYFREYQGELRQRNSISSLKPISFVEESRRMINVMCIGS